MELWHNTLKMKTKGGYLAILPGTSCKLVISSISTYCSCQRPCRSIVPRCVISYFFFKKKIKFKVNLSSRIVSLSGLIMINSNNAGKVSNLPTPYFGHTPIPND